MDSYWRFILNVPITNKANIDVFVRIDKNSVSEKIIYSLVLFKYAYIIHYSFGCLTKCIFVVCLFVL